MSYSYNTVISNTRFSPHRSGQISDSCFLAMSTPSYSVQCLQVKTGTSLASSPFVEELPTIAASNYLAKVLLTAKKIHVASPR